LKPVIIVSIVIIIGIIVILLNGFSANNQIPHPIDVDGSRLHSSDYPLLSEIQFEDFNELVRQCGQYNMPSTKRMCYQGLQEDIDRTQKQNALYWLPESKKYFMCHYLWNDITCLEEVAVKANDPEACYEILNSSSGRDQIVEDKPYLEYRKNVCLDLLN
jgi:hypothetical protein